ncbi:MAG: alanine--glyoxylate aminotransferase family protein [Deltaproteobacteria bacterium]|nr:alanine--glyoxylate aminotransferase family protein [Deltaproteobacteria bacterium]
MTPTNTTNTNRTSIEDTLIMIPGPVPVVPRILRAMAKPVINHRGSEFAELFNECRGLFADMFRTKNDILLLSGSGTSGMEAAVGNLINPDDTIATLVNGKFGERFRDLGRLYGNTVPIESEWGYPLDLDAAAAALEDGADAIAMVHNETSVGMLNSAEEVGKLARKHDALFIMDGITSIGGTEVFVDRWGADIAILGSQKCIGAPPGFAAVSVSERAFEKMKEVKKPPYYLDLKAHKKSADKGQTPYTPSIPLFYAVQEALLIAHEEGLSARMKRHASGATAVRAAAGAMGIEMFPQPDGLSRYSDTVTAMKVPHGIAFDRMKQEMLDCGILIAGGQAHLKGNVFRIGSMGNFKAKDILITIQMLESILHKHGVVSEFGAGTEAAASVLMG